MKTLYSFLLLLTTAVAASAQNFTLNPNPSQKQLFASNGDLICYSTFTNNSTTDSVFTWERYENTKPGDWESEVCDPNVCWDVHSNNAQFTVSPGAEGIFRVTFINPNLSSGNAITALKIYAVNDQGNPDTVLFIGQAYGTSIRENEMKSAIGVYPSPVSNMLTIAYNADRPLKAEIYSLTGVLISSFIYNNDAYDAALLSPGMYVIRLFDGDQILSCKFAKVEN